MKWNERLTEQNQEEVQNIVSDFCNWANGDFASESQRFNVQHLREYGLKNNFFFSGYVVGSALNPEVQPNDVDLLIATNFFPNYGHHQPRFKDLLGNFMQTRVVSLKMFRGGKKFYHRLTPNNFDDFEVWRFLRGQYGSQSASAEEIEHYDRGTDARFTLELVPPAISSVQGIMPIDLIYQWDMISRRHWEYFDARQGKKSEKIFQFGAENPEGYEGVLGTSFRFLDAERCYGHTRRASDIPVEVAQRIRKRVN